VIAVPQFHIVASTRLWTESLFDLITFIS